MRTEKVKEKEIFCPNCFLNLFVEQKDTRENCFGDIIVSCPKCDNVLKFTEGFD